MSMIMILERVSADAVVELAESAILSSSLSDLGHLLNDPDYDDQGSISLEKAWHGLHFLLEGDPWGGSGYRAFLLCGGTEEGEDMGYGPARQFDPHEVQEIHKVLAPITADELWSRFDAVRMSDADIYGADRSEEPESDLREEYLEYFELLKDFVAQAASEGDSIRISMT